jgi:hypothetical protein
MLVLLFFVFSYVNIVAIVAPDLWCRLAPMQLCCDKPNCYFTNLRYGRLSFV